MFNSNVFAERLKKARTEKSLSQAELAEKVGVSTTTISSYEKSKDTKVPALDKAQTIAEILGVSLDWLCGLEVDDTKKLDGVNLLNELSEIVDILEMNAYISNDNEFGYGERLNLICSDNDVVKFFHEREKIIPILTDESIDDYLKEGLKKALFEKFKNFTVNKEYPF